MAFDVTHYQGGATRLRHLGENGRQRLQPPPPVSLTLCVRTAFDVTHYQGGATRLRHLGANGRQRWQPPVPAQLAVCTRMALEVTHHQARGTSHSRLGANSRQRCQHPCARLTHGVHAHGPRHHTPPSTWDEPQPLGRKQLAKMATPLRPPHSRGAWAVPYRSHTVPSVCQAPRLQRHPPQPPRSARHRRTHPTQYAWCQRRHRSSR
jgi:hypothetical protein